MFMRRMASGLLVFGLLLSLSSCQGKTEDEFKKQDGDKTVKPAEAHHHHDEPGPHGGMLADLKGSGHMVELVYAADPRSITVYVVEHNDPGKAVALEANSMTMELEGSASPLTLSAEPQEGDADGKASKFVVMGEAIPETVKDKDDVHGHLKVEAGGKTLEAEFEHHEHDH